MKQLNRLAIATMVLVLFVISTAVAGLNWPVFWVPGALLIWYGLVAGDAHSKIAMQKRMRGGLN